MKNRAFALVLVAMACAGGGANAQIATGIKITTSCSVAMAAAVSNDQDKVVRMEDDILAEWEMRDAKRLEQGQVPAIMIKTTFHLVASMMEDTVEWCKTHPNETIAEAADYVYDKTLAATLVSPFHSN